MSFGCAQHKNDVLWWLFQRLKQGIKCLGRQHVDFIQDVDLVAAHSWRQVDLLLERPDFINTPIGSGVQLQDIQERSLIDAVAVLTVITGQRVQSLTALQAVERFSQNPSSGSFPRSA